MARVLILGGSGVLGRALIAHLAMREYEIEAVVRSREASLRVKSAAPNTTTLAAGDAAGRKYDRVVNLVVDYGRGGGSLSSLIRTNLLYPLDLIESVKAAAVINVSTALPEDYSEYASSKKMLERGLDRVAARRGHRCVNVHLHNIYGPGCDETNLVAALIGRMRCSETIELSSGKNSRDFIYMDDVTSALEALLSRLDRVPDVSAVDVGSGVSTRLSDLVLLIQAKTGSSSTVLYGARPDNPREPPLLAADLRAISATGWKPAWSLDCGLDATAAFMADNIRSAADR